MSEHREYQPTARKRQEARRAGDVARSRLVPFAAIGVVMAAWMLLSEGRITAAGEQVFRSTWAAPAMPGELHTLWEPCANAAIMLLAVLAVIFVVSIGSMWAQVGPIWAPGRVAPDPSRIFPEDLGKRFPVGQLWQDAVGRFGFVLLAVVLLGVGLFEHAHVLAAAAGAPHWDLAYTDIAGTWALRIAGGLLVATALDYAVSRYRFEQQLQMSAEELRAEIRAIEGNPEIARARRDRSRGPIDTESGGEAPLRHERFS